MRGAVPALAVALIATIGAGSVWAGTSLQDALSAQAQDALARAGVPARVTFDGADATVIPDSPDVAQAAADAVASMPGVRSVAVSPQGSATPDAPATTSPPAPAVTAGGTNPGATPSAAPSAAPQSLTVRFEGASARLTADAQPLLDAAADQIRASGDVRVTLVGYTDNLRDEQYRQRLGLERALTVQHHLTQRGVRAPIRVESGGSLNPVADNDTPEGRAQNRRVEIRVERA